MDESAELKELLRRLRSEVKEEPLEHRLAWHIQTGRESLKVDLKWNLALGSPKQRREFATDVAALANARSDEGDTGYLLLGALDEKERQRIPPHPRFACFGEQDGITNYNNQLRDIILSCCDPPPDVSYGELSLGTETYGLITVGRPVSWPVYMHYGRDDKETWEVWTRSGSESPRKYKAGKREVTELYLLYLHRLFPMGTEEEWRNQIAQIMTPTLSSTLGVVRFLAMSLLDDQSPIRAAAVRGFSEIGRLRESERALAVQLLLGMLTDSDYWVVWETARTLGGIGDERAVEPLVRHCIPGERDIPYQALDSVCRLGMHSHCVLLSPLVTEAGLDDDMREAIVTAIEKLGHKNVGSS
jgi:hypothetical protein